MKTGVLLVSLFVAGLALAGAGDIGICYGRAGNNLPTPRETVDLYKSLGINKMRIFSPDPQVLQALRGSNISLMLGVPNSDLQNLTDSAAARRWVQTNVLNYFPDVKIKYIAVGDEVTPVNPNRRYAPFVVPAMTNIYNAIVAAGLFGQIKVSTSIDTGVMDTTYPPSAGSFRGDVLQYMNRVLGFLSDTQGPLLVSVYPYNDLQNNHTPGAISLSYALLNKTSPEFFDNGIPYYNLFDADLDGVHSAIAKVFGSSYNAMFRDPNLAPLKAANWAPPRVVVTATGWPSAGRIPHGVGQYVDETVDNECTYYKNVIRHVRNGTAKIPGVPIETYLFSMFNENQKVADEIDQNFGLFYANKTSKCTFNSRE